jgi:LacI family transcriptional regulator
LDKGFPIVFFDRVPSIDQAITVTVDDYSGAFEATKHLLKQGYRNIVHLSGPANLNISRERERGYTDALKYHGFTPDPNFIVECTLGTDDEAQKTTTEILKTFPKRPDAFFANNDMAAVGAMLACKAAGLRVPEDVGIVGFSNWQFCSMIDPTLTSVAQPGFNMGAKATEILLDLVEKKIQLHEFSNSVVLETELLIRKSSVR